MAIGLRTKKAQEVNKVVLLSVDAIHPNPNQPRRVFDSDALLELAHSIQENGLLQPITVRRLLEGQYELVAGERRLMAFRVLERDVIPAIVEEYSEQQSAVLALIENLQRRDLNFFEEALGIAKLMEQLQLNQQQVSETLGKAQSTVANKLRLLRLPSPLQTRILEAGLTERHARALLKLPDVDTMDTVLTYVAEQSLNVEQTELYIEKWLETKDVPEQSHAHSGMRMFVVKDMRVFHNTITKAVSIMNAAGIPVDSERTEEGDYIEYHIRVPKDKAMQRRPVK